MEEKPPIPKFGSPEAKKYPCPAWFVATCPMPNRAIASASDTITASPKYPDSRNTTGSTFCCASPRRAPSRCSCPCGPSGSSSGRGSTWWWTVRIPRRSAGSGRRGTQSAFVGPLPFPCRRVLRVRNCEAFLGSTEKACFADPFHAMSISLYVMQLDIHFRADPMLSLKIALAFKR
jgi:hypothetical protein